MNESHRRIRTSISALVMIIVVVGGIAITAGEPVRILDGPMVAESGSWGAWLPILLAVVAVVAGSILTVVLGSASAARMYDRIEKHLARSEERLESILDSTADGIVTIDESGTIESFNRAAELCFGWTAQEAIGRNVSILATEPHRSRHDEYLAAYLESGTPKILGRLREVSGQRKDGSTFPLELAVSELDYGVEKRFTAVLRDVTQRQQAQREIRRLAYYDGLTGLPNRRLFQDQLDRALKTAKRTSRSLAVLFIDLDRFKHVNDTLGHSAGDRLLGVVAERLTQTLRPSDYVARSDGARPEVDDLSTGLARLGGDEFTVILSEISQPMDAGNVAKRIRDALSIPIVLDDGEIFVTAGIGIAVYPTDGKDAESLLRCADAAMYHAKHLGGNGFQFYSKRLNAEGSGKLFLTGRLRGALERKELSLDYQPIWDATSRRVVGAEALLRWSDSQLGAVSPEEFIPLLEETGLIVPIGEWVLETATAASRAWRTAGYRPIRMSVNLSGYQIRNSTIVETVDRVLGKAGLSPRDLELELTESTMMQSDEATRQAFRKLREMGVGIALDDFGTGYSSLSLLRRIAIERVKVDRSFVKELTTNGDDRALTSAIIAMAHSLRLKVVAEGVERELQRKFLCDQGCDELQGYLLGRPVPAEDFIRLLDPEDPERGGSALGDPVA